MCTQTKHATGRLSGICVLTYPTTSASVSSVTEAGSRHRALTVTLRCCRGWRTGHVGSPVYLAQGGHLPGPATSPPGACRCEAHSQEVLQLKCRLEILCYLQPDNSVMSLNSWWRAGLGSSPAPHAASVQEQCGTCSCSCAYHASCHMSQQSIVMHLT